MNTSTVRSETGFTLIELLVVVAVLGVVMAIAVVALLNAMDKAKQRATMADMRTVGRAVEAYDVDNGFLPDDSGGVQMLQSVLIPYQINVVPVNDHWSNPYSYTRDAVQYTLESFGKDGVDGGNISRATRHDFDLDIVLNNGTFVASPE